MHSLAWPWLIKFIISTQSEKVPPCLYYSLGFFSFFFKREKGGGGGGWWGGGIVSSFDHFMVLAMSCNDSKNSPMFEGLSMMQELVCWHLGLALLD